MSPRVAPDATPTQSLSSASTPATGAAVLPPDTTSLGRFQLVRALGAGGSGAVFEAIDAATGQRVALKILRSPRPSALKREFRALADIAHPNLVAVHELFIDEQQGAFFSMDLVLGRSFLEYVRPDGEQCDLPRLRDCLEQLARGVSCLHAYGKLHCDLKPSNVLVSDTGQLTIVDFGLVQSRGELHQRTGTPAYAAPEQFDARGALPASDWYAAGGMLYEALSGRRPFPGNTEEVMRLKAERDPEPPCGAQCETLERICMQLLERDPAQRMDGRALLAALGAPAELPEPELISVCAGREAELELLERAWQAVCAGGSRAISISGESGLGKTTLAQHFLARCGDASVFQGRCLVHEALPFNALDEIIEEIGRAQLSAQAPPDGRTRAFHAFRQLLAAMSQERPVLLFVDDLQWADADSLELLRALCRPVVPRLMLLATCRPDTPDALPELERVELQPLAEPAIEQLAKSWLPAGSRELVHEIARKSDGHPLLACELFRYARQRPEAPLELERALDMRLGSLSAEARRALRVLCCAGQRVPRNLLLAGRRPIRPAALRELRVARAARESLWGDEPCLEPYHDSIRRLVNAQLTAARQRRIHRWLAARLTAFGPRHLERALQHHLLGGDEQSAALLAERAASHAADALALHAAADLLALALRHAGAADRQRLRLAAADTCLRAGRTPEAAEHYLEAAAAAAPQDRAELQLRALSAFYVSGHKLRGRALLDALARDCGVRTRLGRLHALRTIARVSLVPWLPLPRFNAAGGDSRERERLHLLWSATLALLGIDAELAFPLGAQALAHAERLGERAIYGQALALQVGLHDFVFGRSRSSERRFEQARELAQSGGEFWDDAFVRVVQAGSAVMAFEHARARQGGLDIAKLPSLRTTASACVRSNARVLSMVALYWSGRIAELSELTRLWLDEALDGGDRRLEFACRTMHCYAHLRTGDAAQALREVDRARALGLDYVQGAGSDPWWVASVALYAGDPLAAVAACDAQRKHYGLYARYSGTTRALWAWTDGLCASALAVRGVERAAQLRRLAGCVRALRRSRSRAARPFAAQLDATLALQRGERARAIGALEEAVVSYDALEMGLHAATARLGLARICGRGGGALEGAALAAFAAQGIEQPERWAGMIAPGL